MMKVKVEGYLWLDIETWDEAAKKEAKEHCRALNDYEAHLEVIEEQRFPAGSWVMLVDPDGEIPDEGPAEIDEFSYAGCGEYTVTIPAPYRDDPKRDVDGLREVNESQFVLVKDYDMNRPGADKVRRFKADLAKILAEGPG